MFFLKLRQPKKADSLSLTY